MTTRHECGLMAEVIELREEVETLKRANAAGHNAALCDQGAIQNLREERDTLRNRIQAFEMASVTSSEIIRGLRHDLDQARKNLQALRLVEKVAPVQVEPPNVSGAKLGAYAMGYGALGKCDNPFEPNTIERLHWENGNRDAKTKLSYWLVFDGPHDRKGREV